MRALWPLAALVLLPMVGAHGGLDDGHPTASAAVAVPHVRAAELEEEGRVVDVGGVRLLLGTNGTHLFVHGLRNESGWVVLALGPGHVELLEGPGGTVVESHYAALLVPGNESAPITGDVVASQPRGVEGHPLVVDAEFGLRRGIVLDPRVALEATRGENVTEFRAAVPLSWLGLKARRTMTVGAYAGPGGEPPEELSKALHERVLFRVLPLGPDDDPADVESLLRRDRVSWAQALFLVALPVGAIALVVRRARAEAARRGSPLGEGEGVPK